MAAGLHGARHKKTLGVLQNTRLRLAVTSFGCVVFSLGGIPRFPQFLLQTLVANAVADPIDLAGLYVQPFTTISALHIHQLARFLGLVSTLFHPKIHPSSLS